MKENLQEVTVKLILMPQESGEFSVTSEILYDKSSIKTLQGCSDISMLKGYGSETSYQLNDSLIFIDKDICNYA